MKTSDKILESITREDIINLMTSFGVGHETMVNGDLRFQSHCHGSDKLKLYYYEKDEDGEHSPHFLCYSGCGGMSIFSTFMQINNWEFKETINYLATYKGISTVSHKPKVFGKETFVLEDWKFLNKYKKSKQSKDEFKVRQLPIHDKKILNVFDNIYPSSWEDEGISTEAMSKFNIMFYVNDWKAIIPHYDYKGNLVGIRGRSFLWHDLVSGRKYTPVYVENESYRHPLGLNLFGLSQNIETIKRVKKVMIVEGEKGVILSETFFPNENFTVALCGSNMSKYQRDLLLYVCGVKEVIIALDKQFKDELLTEDDEKEYDIYIKKVRKIADEFVNYVDVSIIYCDDNRLDYKSCPTDHGEKILKQLMKEKLRYKREDEDSEI